MRTYGMTRAYIGIASPGDAAYMVEVEGFRSDYDVVNDATIYRLAPHQARDLAVKLNDVACGMESRAYALVDYDLSG